MGLSLLKPRWWHWSGNNRNETRMARLKQSTRVILDPRTRTTSAISRELVGSISRHLLTPIAGWRLQSFIRQSTPLHQLIFSMTRCCRSLSSIRSRCFASLLTVVQNISGVLKAMNLNCIYNWKESNIARPRFVTHRVMASVSVCTEPWKTSFMPLPSEQSCTTT